MDKGADEVIILSTCNRSEVYYLLNSESEPEQRRINAEIRQLYIDYFKLDSNMGENLKFVRQIHGEDAIRHIFRVCAGLESAIVGEDEILRQMKEAYEFALRFSNTDKYFNRLFQEAIKCAKEIKSSLKISEIPISTGYIGLKYLEEQAGSFEGKNLMLVGFGEIGRLFYNYAKELPFASITICNRSSEAAMLALAEDKRACYIPSAQAKNAVPQMDIVITATSCPHVLLKQADMPPRKTPVYMLDMSIPRNIDERLNDLPNYHVYNIDVLKSMAARNEASRAELSRMAEKIIDRYMQEFRHWLALTRQDGVIKSLNQSVDDIAEAHLKYLFQKIDVNEREQKIITRTLQSALHKAVRNPILTLKQMDDEDKREHYSEVLHELFSAKQTENDDVAHINQTQQAKHKVG
jgi:glutamyl-tRNA reductase